MQTVTDNYINAINNKSRELKAKAELYIGDALVATYTQNDAIKSIKIDRAGEEGKFFGFGITHKTNIKLRDVERAISLTTDHYFKNSIGIKLPDDTIEYKSFPSLYITEVNRDEKTNSLSITAYDLLERAKTFTVNDLELTKPYTIRNVINAVGAKIGATESITPELAIFDLEYEEGANFEGTELLKDVLIAAAEATQTIYYINNSDALVFKRLDKDGEAVITLSNANYFDLDSKTSRRLATIVSATELGDNVSASITESGTTQYIRNNPFLELRDDIATILDNAIAEIGGITINQFECDWRGDMSAEIGDKLALTAKDGSIVNSYLLNDTITYNGGLSQKTVWEYKETETASSNPTTLGEALKQTYAKVDKANKEITIIASETTDTRSQLSSLQARTSGIEASVTDIKTTQETTEEAIGGINEEINTLTNSVNAKMSAEDVTIAIKTEMENGVTKVQTETGFTFNNEGLTIAKTGSEMKTNIDEDGMTVYRNNEEMLIADNEGVKAYNLHAKTYLIVGNTSRFEDYVKDGEARTGCFWIGG